MIPLKRRGNLRDTKGAHCLYTCPHHLGTHAVRVSLCVLGDAVEASCIELRQYRKWSAKISFAHLGCMLLRNRNSGGSYEDFWDDLSRGVQLGTDGNLEFLTQHIVSFPIVESSRGYKSYLIHRVGRRFIIYQSIRSNIVYKWTNQASNYVNEKETWQMDFLSEIEYPFVLEISIQRRETDSYRWFCDRVEKKIKEDHIGYYDWSDFTTRYLQYQYLGPRLLW
jgi:hypothetical protein